jgi:hypothetical protein
MRIISFIEDPGVMKKILKHLGLWDVKRKPRPVANAPPIDVFHAYDQQPGPSADDYIRDPDYPADLSRRSSKNEDGSLLLKNLKREDRLPISKIRYFQPNLANYRVDITIFILYMCLYWIELVGAWCRISSGPICCFSSPAVTQPCQP